MLVAGKGEGRKSKWDRAIEREERGERERERERERVGFHTQPERVELYYSTSESEASSTGKICTQSMQAGAIMHSMGHGMLLMEGQHVNALHVYVYVGCI